MKKIYLSGPDRLKRNGRELFAEKKELCERYGFEVLEYPDEIYKEKDSFENNYEIAKKRLELIKECDIFIGDTNDFRAFVEPFGETALETGMAYGLEKKVYCYMKDARTCQERYSGEKKYDDSIKKWTDENGIGFEPGPLNLMLEYGGKIVEGGLEDALKQIVKDLGEEERCL